MDDTFESLIDDYIMPAALFHIEVWTTGDLVTLSNLIDAELQKRYDEAKAQFNTAHEND